MTFPVCYTWATEVDFCAAWDRSWWFLMNSMGLTSPIVLCIRSSLISRRQASITTWPPEREEPALIQTLISKLTVETLDKRILNRLTQGRHPLRLGRYQFFAVIAFSALISSVCSATICFNRRFCSSSWRSFFASLTSRPEYFARHLVERGIRNVMLST